MRLRTKISWKLLEDSGKVYNTINYHLFFKRFVVRGAYEEIQMGDWEKDNHLFQFFVDSVNDINKGFFLLYNLKEPNSAYPLIRLQLDNLRLLFAEYLHPFKVLSQTFEKDKDLNQIEVEGKSKIKPSELNKALSERFERFSELYNTYCKYIHPAKRDFYRYNYINEKNHFENYNYVQIREWTIREAKRLKKENSLFFKQSKKDMLYINECIIATFMMLKTFYLEFIEESIGLEEFKQMENIRKFHPVQDIFKNAEDWEAFDFTPFIREEDKEYFEQSLKELDN